MVFYFYFYLNDMLIADIISALSESTFKIYRNNGSVESSHSHSIVIILTSAILQNLLIKDFGGGF